MPKITEPKRIDEETIEVSIAIWKHGLTVVAVILVVTAVVYFWIFLPATGNAQETSVIGNWGAFGDFIGGLMNPLVAFAAFYWLTQSVKIQKQELADTRKTLDVTAKAQEQQVENGYISIRLAAATAIVNTLQSDIGSIEREIEQINARDSASSITGINSVLTRSGKLIGLDINKSGLIKKRDELIFEMERLMNEAQKQSQSIAPL